MQQGSSHEPHWQLVLYVIRGSLLSSNAIARVRRLCAEELEGRADLRIVDIHRHPQALAADGILAVPTLVRRSPRPVRRVIGDLSNDAALRHALGLPAVQAESGSASGSRK